MPSKKQARNQRGIIRNIRDGTFEYESKGALGWYDMQYLLSGRSSKVVRRILYAFNLGNGQFDREMSVWRARLGKRLDSADVKLRRGPKLVGHNIRRVGYQEIMGAVVPYWRGRGCT